MAKFLKNAKRSKKAVKGEDRVGFTSIESGIVDGVVEQAYADQNPNSGATSLFVTFKIGGITVRAKECFVSGNAKGNQTFYTKDGMDYDLPGFSWAEALCLLTTGDNIMDADWQEKKVKIYDYDKKKDVKVLKDVPVDMVGSKIKLGIIVTHNDTPKRDGKNRPMYKNNKAVPSGKYYVSNEVDKFFDPDTCATVVEIREGQEPTFHEKWLAANAGKERDLSQGKAATKEGSGKKAGGKVKGGDGASSDTKSLFGKKKKKKK